MKKLYLLFISVFIAVGISAQDKKVMVVSQNAPDADAIVQKILNKIDSIDGISATHVILDDIVSGSVTYTDYDAAFLTENGGSANMAAYSTAGWPLPTVTLKAYSLYKGDNPLFTQVTGTNWYATAKSADLLPGITDLVVKDNSDILKCYTKDQVVSWTAGYNTTIGTGATEAHIQAFDLKDGTNGQAEIVSHATALADNKNVVDDAAAPATLKSFLWKVDENTITKKLVAWGLHHEFLEYATDDFYSIIQNSMKWVLGMDITCGGGSGIEDLISQDHQIYVNAGQLTVNSAAGVSNINVFDISGKNVISVQNINVQHAVVNIDELRNGLYIVRFATENGEIISGKIVK